MCRRSFFLRVQPSLAFSYNSEMRLCTPTKTRLASQERRAFDEQMKSIRVWIGELFSWKIPFLIRGTCPVFEQSRKHALNFDSIKSKGAAIFLRWDGLGVNFVPQKQKQVGYRTIQKQQLNLNATAYRIAIRTMKTEQQIRTSEETDQQSRFKRYCALCSVLWLLAVKFRTIALSRTLPSHRPIHNCAPSSDKILTFIPKER